MNFHQNILVFNAATALKFDTMLSRIELSDIDYY
jgi:hypothetical protein